MGIEPTWNFVESHTGFEDQERHQIALHLHIKHLRSNLTHRKTKPNVIRLRAGLYRLDLRGKVFRNILDTVSGGMKTLDFSVGANWAGR
jgi:hypothetical protein